MLELRKLGTPRDDQIPDLTPPTLRILSDDIMDGQSSVTDIRGRHRRLRRAAVIVAAAAVAGTVVSLGLPAAPAQAWSATPALVGADTWGMLEADCQGFGFEPSRASAVIVEERGGSNLTVLADGTLCLQVLYDGSFHPAGGGSETIPATAPGGDEIQVIHANVLWAEGIGSRGDPNDVTLTRGYVDTFGRVGPGVERIVIHTVDSGDVVASIDNGWFAAWWPSLGELPRSMTVTTTSGSNEVGLCGDVLPRAPGVRC